MRPPGPRSVRNTTTTNCYFLLVAAVLVAALGSMKPPNNLLRSSSRLAKAASGRWWRQQFQVLLRAGYGTPILFPMANAFIVSPTTLRSSRMTVSSLSAAVVPELDDSFPDDYGDNANIHMDNIANIEGLPPPEDYFPGAQDFELQGYTTNAAPPETEVVNPFPFPEPTFSYGEDGDGGPTTSSMSMDPEETFAAPFSVPESIPTATLGDAKDGDLDDRISNIVNTTTTPSTMVEPKATNAKNIHATTTSLNSTNDSGRRTMTTMTNTTTAEEAPSSFTDKPPDSDDPPLYDTLPEDELPPPPLDEAEQEAFAPFASIMEDTGPIKPLVAPLKLSPPSHDTNADTTAASTAPASTTPSVPSIEANRLDDLVDSLQGQLKSVEREIAIMAPPSSDDDDGSKISVINLNSPKQVSQLLFGRPDMSTNKSTLEGMAASNILAKLVLEYRDIKRRLNKVLKQQESRNAATANPSETAATTTSSESSAALPPPRPMKDPVWLFDTSSFIFRAYYSNPPIHRGRDGMPVGAVMGFCSMLNKLLLTSMLRGETPILVQCLDAPGKSFRSDLYPDYKAHRPPIPLDLVPQFDLINKAAKAYGMIQIQATGFEADDVIATLATRGSQNEGLDVKILSGDKDLMQLVTEEEDNDSDSDSDDNDETGAAAGRVHMVDPMTSKVWNHDMVLEKWGVKASQLGDVLALAGDSADNVPGVPGIGPKIAAQLLQEFGTLESLLQNTDQIPQPKRREKLETNADSAKLSRILVDLKRDLEWSQMQAFHPPPLDHTGDYDAGSASDSTPMPESTKISDLRMQPIQPDRILAFYDDMGFHKIKNQLLDRLGRRTKPEATGGTSQARRAASAPSSPKPVATAQAKAAAPKAKAAKPKTSTKRNSFWEKKTRTVPKPEDFKDVPF